jgi:hypothetical protein
MSTPRRLIILMMRLTSITYETKCCSGDREVRAYSLLCSGGLLVEIRVLNDILACYLHGLLHVFSQVHSTAVYTLPGGRI